MANSDNTTNQLSTELVTAFIESSEEFPISFDDAWQWLGYKRKDIAKETLSKNFVKGIDYAVTFSALDRKKPVAGRPSDSLVLTIDCFKSLAMMAGTAKGKEVRQYFLQCEKELLRLKEANQPATQPKSVINAYAERVAEAEQNCKNIPPDHWCVLIEAAKLLIFVEHTLKMPVDRSDLLDGSVGSHWSNYRKGKPWAKERIKFNYTFPDGRDVDPWAYQNSELLEFRYWLDNIYKPKALPAYLLQKYGAIVKV